VRRTVLLGALAAIAAIGLSACGDSGPSAEEEVSAAAAKAVATEDSAQFCRRLVSERFLDEVVDGDVAACVDSTLVGEDPGVPAVSAVEVDEEGTRATVMVRVEGGENDGSAGHLAMVRVGERWVLDRYEDDYLRSAFLVAIENAEEGAIAVPKMKACMGRQAAELGPNRIREIAIDASTDPAAMVESLLPLGEKCPAGLAEYGAKEIADSLAEEGKRSPEFIRCIRTELEAGLLLTDITPELLGPNPDFGATLALEGLAAAAKQRCG
jgi:hypothetical protein